MLPRLLILFFINLLLFVFTVSAQTLINHHAGFSLKVPAGWKVAQEDQEAAVISHQDNNTTIGVFILPKYPIAHSQVEFDLVINELVNGYMKTSAGTERINDMKIANQESKGVVYTHTTKKGEVRKIIASFFWVNDALCQVVCNSPIEKYETARLNFMEVVSTLKLASPTAYEWAIKGQEYQKNREYSKAVEAFNKASKLDAKNTDCIYQLSYTYAEMKNYKQGVDEISKAIKLMPENSFYYHERGYFYIQLKKPQLALADANKAIELSPKIAVYYAGRGNAEAMLGRYEAAIKDFQKCLELKGDEAAVNFNLGQIYELMGNKEQALLYYKISGLAPNLSDTVTTKIKARLNDDWDNFKEWI